MSSDNVFVLLEAKEHMISEDTKKTKFTFLFSCMVTIALCLFQDAELYSLFGIIRVKEGIQVFTIIPIAMLITAYQASLYRHYYKESINAWVNKTIKNEKVEKDGLKDTHICHIFKTFNDLSIKVDKYSESILSNSSYSSPLYIETEKIESLFSFVKDLDSSVDKANRSFLEQRLRSDPNLEYCGLEKIKNELKGANNMLCAFKNVLDKACTTSNLEEVSRLYIKARCLNNIRTNLEFDYISIEKAEKIQLAYNELVSILEHLSRLESICQEKFESYRSEQIEKELKLGELLPEIIEQRDEAIQLMKSTMVNEKANKLLFKWLPSCVFVVTIFTSTVVLWGNRENLILSLKSLNIF